MTLILIVCLVLVFTVKQANAPESDNSPTVEHSTKKPTDTANPEPKDQFDKTKYSIDDPSSLWVVVNKQRPLPDGYVPANLSGVLRADAGAQLDKLLAAANSAGHPMHVISGFRTQGTQAATYNNYVRADGQAKADTYSARPRHSEHQTGLVADLGNGACDLQICFGQTPAGKWLAANAYKYGFIIRYLEGKEMITGYQYEPWHVRYVGAELAGELHQTGQTMEEFFGLPAAPNY